MYMEYLQLFVLGLRIADCVGLHIGNIEILATGEPSKTGFVVSFFKADLMIINHSYQI